MRNAIDTEKLKKDIQEKAQPSYRINEETNKDLIYDNMVRLEDVHKLIDDAADQCTVPA